PGRRLRAGVRRRDGAAAGVRPRPVRRVPGGGAGGVPEGLPDHLRGPGAGTGAGPGRGQRPALPDPADPELPGPAGGAEGAVRVLPLRRRARLPGGVRNAAAGGGGDPLRSSRRRLGRRVTVVRAPGSRRGPAPRVFTGLGRGPRQGFGPPEGIRTAPPSCATPRRSPAVACCASPPRRRGTRLTRRRCPGPPGRG